MIIGDVNLAFGKRKPAKKSVVKPEIKLDKTTDFKNKISAFSKKIKVNNCNDLGLPKEKKLELFIRNKIKSSRRFNGWYITINAFNFAEKIGHEADIIHISDLVEKIHKTR